MNRDLVRVLKQRERRHDSRLTNDHGAEHATCCFFTEFELSPVPSFPKVDFSTNRSTRSHRVETFNRTLPQSREGGQESRRKHPPPPPLPLFLLEEQSKILAKEIVPPANFFLSSTNRRLSFQKGGKSEVPLRQVLTSIKGKKRRRETMNWKWIDKKIPKARRRVRCVFFLKRTVETVHRYTEDKGRETGRGSRKSDRWKELVRKVFERKSWKDRSKDVG